LQWGLLTTPDLLLHAGGSQGLTCFYPVTLLGKIRYSVFNNTFEKFRSFNSKTRKERGSKERKEEDSSGKKNERKREKSVRF